MLKNSLEVEMDGDLDGEGIHVTQLNVKYVISQVSPHPFMTCS